MLCRISIRTVHGVHGQNGNNDNGIIDATETGDVLEAAGVEHVFGAEAQSDTQEPHALALADPFDQQALTWCLAADYLPGEDHTIDRPADYDRLKTLQLACWPGPQFSWILSDFVTHQPRERPLFAGDTDEASLYDLWHARRIAWRKHFRPGTYASDITLANWPQMDYWEKPVVGVSPADAATALREARRCPGCAPLASRWPHRTCRSI